MTNASTFQRRGPALAAAALASLLLAACGGGGDLAGLSTEVAQGYGADAAGMPVSAGESVVSAAEALESSVAIAAVSASIQAAPDRMQIESVLPLATATASAACAGGGTAAWTVDGPAGTLGNRLLDAGETYTVTYSNCATLGGPVLDGSVQWVVAARSLSASDITVTMTNLRSVTAVRTATLNGSARLQRTTVLDVNGGRTTTAVISSPGMTLASVIGTRNANYTLNSYNWTVVRTFNGAGALTARTHSGSLSLAASTPRRPNATLDITSQSALAVDSNGLVASGSFSVITDRNKITGTYGTGTIALTLDLGNDGSVDRTWTLTRQVFEGEAG
jgi:hypothetical protein